MNKVKKHQAFTLMEVIVALSLFAISIMVLTQSFLNGLICKTQLGKEDFRPLLYQIIRSELKSMPREKVALDHIIYYPNNETKVSWNGSVEFTGVWNLFKINVQLKGEDERMVFLIHQSDWMTKQEKEEFLSRNCKEKEISYE